MFLLVPAAIAVLAAAGIARASAADLVASCHTSLPAASFAPAKIPEGWAGVMRGPLHLDGAGMMAGPPSEMEYLVPDRQGRDNQVFDFQAGDRQRWLWCGYSGGAQLSRRMDDQATKCTLTTRGKRGESMSAAVKCSK